MGVTVIHTDGNQCRLAVEGEMTIYTAAAMKEQLLSPFARCEEVEINLAGVSEIDAAGLQLLLLAKVEAVVRDRTLRLVDHSPAVLNLIDLSDLGGVFGDPVLIRSKA